MITSRLAVILLAVLVAAPCLAQTASSGSATAVMCVPARDKAGHIKRNSHQTVLFKRNNPCPANGATAGPCPGHVIDHIVPLCACGPDKPDNMQWQTIAEAKAKDKIEIRQCGQE